MSEIKIGSVPLAISSPPSSSGLAVVRCFPLQIRQGDESVEIQA